MTATPNLWASGTPTTSGSTWASATNATGGNDSSNATFTNATSGGSGFISLSGYKAQNAIGRTPASVDSVVVTAYYFVSSASLWTAASCTAQLFDGATALGSPVQIEATLSTTAGHSVAITFTGVASWTNLANLTVRLTWTHSGTTSGVVNIDAVGVTVNYTPATGGTFTPVGAPVFASTTPFSISPAAVGDFFVLFAINKATGVAATSVSGGNCTWTQVGTTFTGTANTDTVSTFIGQVTATGAAAVTVTFSGVTTNPRMVAREFKSSDGLAILDSVGTLDSTGTATWPSPTAAGSNELYVGFCADTSSAVAGSTSGFAYEVDPAHGNGLGWNTAYVSGTPPVWGDSAQLFGQVVVLTSVLTGSGNITAKKTRAAGSGTNMMPAPAGYATLLFEDSFTGSTLDATKWVTYLGDKGGRWDNAGGLPSPYSASNAGGNNLEMYAPSQVTVNNGLTLTAQANTNAYAASYPWISGVVTTEGLFSLPTSTAWYVQVKAQMPDTSLGMWPAIWFLRGTAGSPENELDAYEGGWSGHTPVNNFVHSDFFADQGQQQSVNNAGVDLSAGYHVYGVEFIPGTAIRVYVDGTKIWEVLASSGITIAAEPYQIMLQLQVASSATSGFHTQVTGSTPTSQMLVAEVQAWGASTPTGSGGLSAKKVPSSGTGTETFAGTGQLGGKKTRQAGSGFESFPLRPPEALSGSVTETTFGGSVTNIDPGFTGSAAIAFYTGTYTQTSYGGSLTGWTMQIQNIVLMEHNDETLDVVIQKNGANLNITGYTVEVYFKTSSSTSDTDPSTLKLSTATGEITITNAASGGAEIAVPAGDLSDTTHTFWRLDVVNAGKRNTVFSGNVTVTPL